MKKLILTIKKALVGLYLLVFSMFYSFPVLFVNAEELETGPIEPVGIQSEIGRAGRPGPVGLVEPTGRQEIYNGENLINSATGPQSENNNDIENENELLVESTNKETTDNNIDLGLNSGKNTLQENTEVGSLTTGDIDGSVNLINLSNSALAPGSSVGATTIDGNSLNSFEISKNDIPSRVLFPNSSIGSNNDLTGARSLNTNNIDNSNIISFILDNDVLRNNLINVNANTGENIIDSNNTIGEILTGNIDLGVNIINLSNIINENLLAELNIWSIVDGLDGNIVLPSNVATGPNSENLNLIENSTIVDTEISTDTENTNDFDIKTNTGENKLESNTSVGNIKTGDTEVRGSITNITDAPVFYIINVFGKFLGNVLTDSKNFLINEISDTGALGNRLTGPSSLNSNEIDNTAEINTDINSKVINNNRVNINANTGKNDVSNNTLVQGLETGSIDIISNVVNAAGFLGKKLKLGIINIFGDLKGNVISEENAGAVLGGAKEEDLIEQQPVEVSLEAEEEIPAALPISMVPGGRVLGQIEELPVSGVLFSGNDASDNQFNKETNNRNARKDILTLVLPASLLLALSLYGDAMLRKRKRN